MATIDAPAVATGDAFQEILRVVRQALLSLPADQSRAVLLRDVRGLSTRQSAELIGVDEREFRNRLNLGRVTLHAELSRYLAGVTI